MTIGRGPLGYNRDKPIKVIGNFTDNSITKPPGWVDESDYCEFCSVKLVIRKTDNAKMCPKCGWTSSSLPSSSKEDIGTGRSIGGITDLSDEPIGTGVIIPMSRPRRNELSSDPDTRRLQERGYYILSSTEEIPIPNNNNNAAEVINTDELRRTNQYKHRRHLPGYGDVDEFQVGPVDSNGSNEHGLSVGGGNRRKDTSNDSNNSS